MYEVRGTKYDIFLMSNAERRVQNAEVGQRATAKRLLDPRPKKSDFLLWYHGISAY